MPDPVPFEINVVFLRLWTSDHILKDKEVCKCNVIPCPRWIHASDHICMKYLDPGLKDFSAILTFSTSCQSECLDLELAMKLRT